MKTCEQLGCQTPRITGIKYRVWVHAEHYDHRTKEAAERRISKMSRYERENATIQEVTI